MVKKHFLKLLYQRSIIWNPARNLQHVPPKDKITGISSPTMKFLIANYNYYSNRAGNTRYFVYFPETSG